MSQLQFANFFAPQEKVEYEVQSVFILSRRDFDEILPTFEWSIVRKFSETRFESAIKKRIGYECDRRDASKIRAFVSWKRTITSQLHVLHLPRFFLTHPPIILRTSHAIEYNRVSEQLRSGLLRVANPLVREVVAYVKRENSVEYRLGFAVDLRNLSTEYFFHIEQEFATAEEYATARDYIRWNFDFLESVAPVKLPPLSVPLRAPTLQFTHSGVDVAPKNGHVKPKVDGVRFIAVHSNGWCCFYDEDVTVLGEIESAMQSVGALPEHYIYLFEYVDHRAVLTEVVAARNTPLYRNTLVHQTYENVQVDERVATVNVDLDTSHSMLTQIEGLNICITNVSMARIVSARIPIDGALIQTGPFEYMKVKAHHTIELLFESGRFFTATSELLPLQFTIADPNQLLHDRGIYEFRIDRTLGLLVALKRRTDKCTPDSFDKVFSLLFDPL